MRLIKSLLVAAIVATTSLATAGAAQAERLSSVSFLNTTASDILFTSGTNVRVSYRCTSRIRTGLIAITHHPTGFRRQASARCDGVPRSVLLRTRTGENAVFMRQETVAFGEFVVFGKPFPCGAVCQGDGP